MRAWIAIVACAACGSKREQPREQPPPAPAVKPACEPLPFASSIPLAEASGAALIAEGLIVVADSGNHGAYMIVDTDTGDVRAQGRLPLPDGVSDDVEGLASPDGTTLTGLTSDGTLLHWTGFALDRTARITDDRKLNFEGLCLSPRPDAACDGYAASKADGRLYCLRGDRIDPTRTIAITNPDSLADCAFSPDGRTLLAAGNVFTADQVWRVDPATGAVEELAKLGPGNGEVVVAAPDNVVYRFSDLNTAPSLAGKFRCAPGAR